MNTSSFLKKRKIKVAIFENRDRIMCGGVAQPGEHMHHTHGVAGSNPVVSI